MSAEYLAYSAAGISILIRLIEFKDLSLVALAS